MRVAIIGQQAFGAAMLDAFLKRGGEVPGAKPDPLRVAALERGLEV
jgi:methionyl-tRNA formyltransferase